MRPERRILGRPPIRSRLGARRTQFQRWNCVPGQGIRVSHSSPSRGRSGRSSPSWVNHSNCHQYRPPAARPPTGASSSRCVTTGRFFRRRPTNCPRSTSTASDPSRARGINGAARRPDSERLRAQTGKPPLRRGKAGVPATTFWGPVHQAISSLAVHPLGNGRRSAIAGLSLRPAVRESARRHQRHADADRGPR